MKVEFNRLFEKLKAEGITQKQFRDSVGIGGTTFKKLRGNESITTETICKVCDYFHCMPDESKRLNFRHGYKNPRPHFCNRSTLTIHI